MAKILSLFILFALLAFTSCCPIIAQNSDARRIQFLVDKQDVVVLDAGRHYFFDEPVIVDDNTKIIGNWATIELVGGTIGFEGFANYVEISQLTFIGEGQKAVCISWSFNSLSHINLLNCGLDLRNGVSNSISYCKAINCWDISGDAVFVLSGCIESGISFCEVYGTNRSAFLVSACPRGATVIGCIARDTYWQGGTVSNSPNTSWIGNRFYRCSKDGNHQGAITITPDSEYALCVDNYIIDCYVGFFIMGDYGLYTGNYIYACNEDFKEYGNPVGNEYFGNKWE